MRPSQDARLALEECALVADAHPAGRGPLSASHADAARGAAARRARRAHRFVASVSAAALQEAPAPRPAQAPKPAAGSQSGQKPATDVLAGALARAASQSTIHPIDTIKVRMQSGSGPGFSKFSRLVPPAGSAASVRHAIGQALPRVASLYSGVLGAASGAGIAIGAYFACYGAAHNAISRSPLGSRLNPGGVAFFAGATAAAGSSVVKVPIAVCIRSVQAGRYPNALAACSSIVRKAGVGGLFTGFLPTLLEDIPDMAFKFAAYETLRQVHRQMRGQTASPQEDFVMGAAAGAFAAAATTPLDVVKTNMMVNAASRPSMMQAAASVLSSSGVSGFFRGLGPRALSNGVNSAVFFCFFEALSRVLRDASAERTAAQAAKAARATQRQPARAAPAAARGVNEEGFSEAVLMSPQPASISVSRPCKAKGPRSDDGVLN